MSWIDNLLSSSTIVYLLLAIIGMQIYLRKTKQTLPEVIRRIRDFFSEWDKEEK
jgi:hypothetical protein